MEFSIVNLSEVDSIKKRIDAEYYKKYYLSLEEKINEIGKIHIKDLNVKLECSAFYPSITEYYNFEYEGVPFLRVSEIQDGLVSITPNTAFLPQFVLDSNKNTIAIAYPGDIVIAKGGNTLAKLGLVTSQYPYYSLSRDLILLRTNNLKEINKYYLWVFLHSKYGQDLLWRTASQTGQPHLTLPSIEEIGLPRYSDTFENKFETMYKRSIEFKDKSIKAYKEAETLLFEELGLNHLQISMESVNVKNLKDSFLSSGRLDPEYYQPKFEDFESLIKKSLRGFTLINHEYDLVKKTSDKTKDYYNYIEIGDIDVTDGSAVFNKIQTEDLPANAKIEVEKGDLLISNVRPNRGAVTIIDFNVENLIVSGAFTVLREREESIFSNEVLKVLLRTNIYKEWLLKFNVGTQYPVIRDEDVLNLPIPKIDKLLQENIKEKVRLSQRYKKQSEILLDNAKKAIEIAIEQNEAAAISFIDKSLAKA